MNIKNTILLVTLFLTLSTHSAESEQSVLNEQLQDHAWQMGTWMAVGDNGNTWLITFTPALNGNAILLDGKQVDSQGATLMSMHAVRSYDPNQKALVTVFKGANAEPSWSNMGSIKPGFSNFRRTTVNADGQIETHLTLDKEINADTYHNIGLTLDGVGKIISRNPWEHRRVTHFTDAIREVEVNAEAYVMNLVPNPYQFHDAQWKVSDLEIARILLTNAIHMNENNARLFSARARVLMHLEQWELAARDYLTFSELDEKGGNDGHHASLIWMDGAALQAKVADLKDYQLYCHRMLGRFGGSRNLMTVERIAKSALFHKTAEVDLQKATKLAEFSLRMDWPHAKFVKALADYRLGQTATASEFVDQCLSNLPGRQPFLAIQANLLGALIAKAQSNESKFKLYRDRAESNMRGRKYSWFHNRVICESLLAELKSGR